MTPFEFLIIEGQNSANQLPCPLPSPSRNESTGIGFEVAAFIMIDATLSLFL